MRNVQQQVEDNAVIGQQLAENLADGAEIDDGDEPSTPFDDGSSSEKPRRGRPPKADSAEPAPDRRKFKYFPVPIRKTVGVTKEWGQGEFFKYWKKVAAEPELRDRAVCYVYRTFPVTEINPPGENLEEVDSKKPKYIDCTSQPFENDEDVWNRYGAGDYKFYLNDSGFPGRAKTQLTCYFAGTREWDKYPPQIELKTLVLDDPKNGSYKRYLEMKGLLHKPEEENEEDMAREGIIEKLTDRVIEMSSRPEPVPAPVAVPLRHEDDSRAVRALAETFAQTNRVQLEMIQAAVNQATAVQARAADPFDTLAKVMTTVRELVPKPDNTALEEALRRSERLEAQLGDIGKAIQEQRIKDLESRLAQPQQPGAPPRDALTAAREFAELQREYRQIFAGDNADDDEPRRGREPREPWYAKLAPSALGLSAFLLAGVANIFHNRAVAATGQGQPAPPPQPPAEMIPPGVQQVAGALTGQPHPAAGDPAVMALSPQEQQVATFISMIQLPLDRHLESGATGHEFAAWMVDSYGDSVYQQIRTAGADGIQSALQRFAPGLFQKMQAMPDRSAQFLKEFIEGPDMDEENN